MDDKTDDWLDPKAEGKRTTKADFDRNRDGIYGGLPEARLDSEAKGENMAEEMPKADFDRNRDGIYGGLPGARPESEAKGGKTVVEMAKETTKPEFDRKDR